MPLRRAPASSAHAEWPGKSPMPRAGYPRSERGAPVPNCERSARDPRHRDRRWRRQRPAESSIAPIAAKAGEDRPPVRQPQPELDGGPRRRPPSTSLPASMPSRAPESESPPPESSPPAPASRPKSGSGMHWPAEHSWPLGQTAPTHASTQAPPRHTASPMQLTPTHSAVSHMPVVESHSSPAAHPSQSQRSRQIPRSHTRPTSHVTPPAGIDAAARAAQLLSGTYHVGARTHARAADAHVSRGARHIDARGLHAKAGLGARKARRAPELAHAAPDAYAAIADLVGTA